MENAFNTFALFFPEKVSSTFLSALQISQIYLAIQCDFSLQLLKKGVSWICKVTEMQHRRYESVTSIANTHYLDTLAQIT